MGFMHGGKLAARMEVYKHWQAIFWPPQQGCTRINIDIDKSDLIGFNSNAKNLAIALPSTKSAYQLITSWTRFIDTSIGW